MRTVEADDTVATTLDQHPGAVRAFTHYRIDYCCGGQARLVDACRRAGAELTDVIAAILQEDAAAAARGDGASNPASKMSVGELADYVVATHHAFTSAEAVRLTELASIVADRHGERAPQLAELASCVRAFFVILTEHMRKEEGVLFPYFRTLDSAKHAAIRAPFVAQPIAAMRAEHDEAGEAMRRIRALTDEFRPPADACRKWRALYDGLLEHERDLMTHVHLENNVLFPRAIALEQELLNNGRERMKS